MRGALLLCIAMACFALNDSLVKLALHTLTLGQIIFIRGVIATTLLVLFFHRSLDVKQLPLLRHPASILRIVAELMASLLYLTSLIYLSIGFVTAINQALPLVITAGAALFLAEPVGWRRWTAVTVGFMGVLIIVRPGLEGFSAWSLLTLASVVFSAMRDLSTRRIPKEISSSVLSISTSLAVTIFGGLIITPMGGWQPMSLQDGVVVFTAAAALVVGYHCLIMAMREGELSFVAPFRYTGLLWATLIGYLLFADIPDELTIAGSALVIGSGLYTLYRERRVSKAMPVVQSTGPGMSPDGL